MIKQRTVMPHCITVKSYISNPSEESSTSSSDTQWENSSDPHTSSGEIRERTIIMNTAIQHRGN